MAKNFNGAIPPRMGDFITMLCQTGAIDDPAAALDAFGEHLHSPLGDFNAQYDIILYQDNQGNKFVALEYDVEGLTEIARYKATPKRRE